MFLFMLVLLCRSATEATLDTASSTGSAGGHSSRRLTEVRNILPDDTAQLVWMGAGNAAVYRPSHGAGFVQGLHAGQRIVKIGLSLPNGYTFSSQALTTGKLRLVGIEVNRQKAQVGFCKPSYYNSFGDAVVSSPWPAGSRLVSGGAGILESAADLTILVGGGFRVCYSEDGTFEQADVLNVTMQVKGVTSTIRTCDDGTCLYSRKYYCYLLKQRYNTPDNTESGQTSCEVILGEYDGGEGKGSWSSYFQETYNFVDLALTQSETPVRITSVTAQQCTTSPAAFLGPTSGGCFSGGVINVPLGTVGVDDASIPLPPGRDDLGECGRYRAYTVAACYCADYDGCNSPTDFTQQVGILYYYITKTCFHGNDALACDPDFTGTATPFRFALQVRCPSDACKSSDSRLKIVVKSASNDEPSWSSNNGCFSAVHGINALGRDVLPQAVNLLDVTLFDGGPREDLKLWNLDVPALPNETEFILLQQAYQASQVVHNNNDIAEMSNDIDSCENVTNLTNCTTTITCTTFTTSTSSTSTVTTTTTTTTIDTANETAGFQFVMGTNLQEQFNFQFEYLFDVCFCNAACHKPRNWFKAGEVRATSVQLVSAATNLTSEAHQMIVQYVNQPGILGFYRPQNASHQLGMHEGGILKVLEDNTMAVGDAECRYQDYSTTLTNTSLGVPLSSAVAATHFQGKVVTAADPLKLVFNSGDLENTLKFNRAGVVAICYCPKLEGGSCFRDNWVLATRVTIRGPVPGQTWTFSTHVVFRFSFEGYGLTTSDRVRIVAGDTDCTYNKGRPDGDTATTGIKLGCPWPCYELGTGMQPINGDISASLLSSDHYLCDSQGVGCRTCDIQAIDVKNSTHTELYFDKPPHFSDGDLITLGDNIICDTTDAHCTPDALATLKGHFNFVDGGMKNNPAAPDTYLLGHAVQSTSSINKYLIPVGWQEPFPRFVVVMDSSFRRGKWVRHSKSTTKEEIIGTKAIADLKVCWKYGSDVGSYVTDVGRMTFKEPAPMSKCLISMTSTVRRLASPVVISFRTSAPGIATRYATVQGMTQLRLLWTNLNALVPRLTDGLVLSTSTFTDEISEARQYICGSIFKEMWSSDPVYGFPLPRGCYHRSFGDMLELNILFERKNGLRGDQDYQLVLNAKTQEGVAKFGTYLDITVMDDTELRPYESIERGQAYLNADPQSPAGGTAGVMFLEPNGFTVINGDYDGLIELTTGKAVSFELRGEPMGGGIRPNSFLRIFLWPLTQWNVPVGCAATCVSSREAETPCGAVRTCSGERTVKDFQRNVLKLQLPSSMTQVQTTGLDSTHATITIADLALPPGGILPTNFGAQISMPITDSRPHYLTSVGALMWKAPSEGQTYARVVTVLGDGDQKPFRSDTENVLYAHIVLGLTLYSAVQTGDATMTITLPEGYQCLRPQDIQGQGIEKISPWMAEETLSVFGNTIPQGRGTPDEGAGTRGWSVNMNNCTWKLVQNAVVYAYSSIYVRFTVNNPPVAMKREDPKNTWYVTLRGKGFSAKQIEFAPVLFTSSPPNFAANVPVLGSIDQATIVPWSWSNSPNAAPSDLYIFFLTQQLNNVEGFVQIDAPNGFEFDTKNGNCEAHDLPDAYYAKSNQGYDTDRLPGIVSCTYRPTPFNMVDVKLEGMLVQNQWYGLKLRVKNTASYTPSQQEEWKIFTLTKLGHRVDGTLLPVKMDTIAGSLSSNKSFGVFRYNLSHANAFLSSLLPYVQTGQRTTVTVRPLKLPITIMTTLRVIAPLGFIWDFGAYDFRKFPDSGTWGVDCISAAMPGGVPATSEHLLYWDSPVLFSSSEIYGFSTFIRVPIRSPTSSINAFIIQFGYASTNSTGRIASATVMPNLDYGNTNIDINQSHLIFQMQVGEIKPGGRITITGSIPNPYKVPMDCTHNLSTVVDDGRGCRDGSSATLGVWPRMLPADVICNATTNGFILTVGATRILAGLYRFQLQHQGGEAATSRRLLNGANKPLLLNPSSACGLDRCWTYEAVGDTVQTGTFNGPINVLEQLRSSTEVPALSDASLTYSCNAAGEDNFLTFTIQTATGIPHGGGLQLTGPEEFKISSICSVLEPGGLRGSPYYVWSMKGKFQKMPPDVTCKSALTNDDTVAISLKAGPSGIKPGLYRFQLKVKNPSNRLTNPLNIKEPCGFRHCWLFTSVLDLSKIPLKELDVRTWIPSFVVNSRFSLGNFTKLLSSQRAATMRDDRPLMSNSVVLQFILAQASVYPSHFKIHAPVGYIFREECLPDILTNGSAVFGGPLPASYAPWDQGIVITHCRGDGPDMVFHVDPGRSVGLPSGKIIPIRVTILRNPVHLPVNNRWTIEFAGESSVPFDGLPVWTFTRTSCHGVSWARRPGVVGVPFFTNVATLTFRPSISVHGKGTRLIVQAPPYYEMTHEQLECIIALQRLDVAVKNGSSAPPMNFTDISSLLSPAFVRWGESEYSCRVDATDWRRLVVTVTADFRELLAGEDYQLTVSVRNPTFIAPTAKWDADYPWVVTPSMWSVQIEAGPDAFEPSFRDLGFFESGDILPVLVPWTVSWKNPITKNFNDVTRGKTLIHNVHFTVGFTGMPREQDVIFIEAPFGFNLTENPTEPSWTAALATTLVDTNLNWAPCNNLAWMFDTEYDGQTAIACSGRRMRITITNDTFHFATWADPPPLLFTMSMVTSVKTPHESLNYWLVRHVRDNIILSENALVSWPIRPQLENVMVNLTGENKAAQSTSTIEFYFTPMSDAAELIVKATSPAGFNFKSALAVSLGHEVLPDLVNAYPASEVRVRCTLFAGLPVIVRLTKLTLGYPGGWTMFDFTTRLSNGEVKDQSLDLQGFRLPGKITVVDQSLQNQFQQDPAKHPVPALWKTRMSESATAKFTISFSEEAVNGTLLRIRAPPYVILSATLLDMDNRDMFAEVYELANAEVTLRLPDPVFAGESLRVALPVLTPSVGDPTDAMWTFEILDSDALPANTNDGATEGFPLAAPIGFGLIAVRSPPLAEIEVTLAIDPRGTSPSEFILVAPPDFNITENCLKDGAKKIASCVRTADVLGRQAALLRAFGKGLLTPVSSVIIKIVTAKATATSPSWYLQARDVDLDKQLGWAEFIPGIQVKQMPNAGVVYSGMRWTANLMIVRFQATIRAKPKSKIRVHYPSLYAVGQCDDSDLKAQNFRQISLKGTVDCLVFAELSYFELFLHAAMDPGWQAFGMMISLPNTAVPNTFDILVYEPTADGGKIIDGATELPGFSTLDLKVDIKTLVWGDCKAMSTCPVRIVFDFKEDMPGSLCCGLVNEIVVKPPQTLEYKITELAEVKIETPGDPLRLRDPPLDVSAPAYFRLLLNTQVPAEKHQFDQGGYSIQFATKMPVRAPANNVWMMIFCGAGNTTCIDEHSPRAMTSFPLVGFNVGATHATGTKSSTSGVVHACSFACAALVSFLYSWWLC